MEQNTIFHDRYKLKRLLGRGNFSEVWLALDTKTQVDVALKIYAPATGLDDEGLNVLAREFSLVVNVNHKNVLKPLYYDSYDRKPYLVLPFCKNGSSSKLVGKISENDAWRFIRDVASGLSYLHDHDPSIIHQDIKPDNVMVADNGDFMITDFGVSTHARSTLRKSMSLAFKSAGTTAYMGPERFSHDNTPIKANDIYSLGATIFELLAGDAPFGDDGGLLQMKGAQIPVIKRDFSPQLKKVVQLCLKADPWERPTSAQLEKYAVDALSGRKIHFEDNNKKKLSGTRAGSEAPVELWTPAKVSGNKMKIIIAACACFVVMALAAIVIFNLSTSGEKEPQLTQALIDRPEYERLFHVCDSLTTIGDMSSNEGILNLIKAKETLALLKEYELRNKVQDSSYNLSLYVEYRLQTKCKEAAEAWLQAADVQDAIGETEKAAELREVANQLL